VRAEPSAIPGCARLHPFRAGDARGSFLKLFERSAFAELGFDTEVAEVFCSTSGLDVIRGLHFQLPPHAHAKTVVVLAGRVLDVVVDLRTDSPMFGRHVGFELDGSDGAAVHIPVGCAHGFQALTDGATMAYLVSTENAPDHDTGVRWDSAGIGWPRPPSVVSDRDAALPPLAELVSPFRLPAPVGS
jgi:dTDP-4-dehydrorhamnose 3,5-epimerase